MRDLVEHTRAALAADDLLERGDTVIVGVSGGVDSVALLDVLARLAEPLRLTVHVAHLDHRLRPDSAEDASFVADLAARLGVSATLGQADVAGYSEAAGLSVEEAARHLRYAFLGAVARQQAARRVAVAHHLQDQAETVLLNLLRGAGLAGLRGMTPLAPLPPAPDEVWTGGWLSGGALPDQPPTAKTKRSQSVALVRPLLQLPKADILAYVAERGLPFREDSSNRDPRFTRNRLRHELLPLLATYNPAIVESLGRMARRLADDLAYLEEQADELWPHTVRAVADGLELDLNMLTQQPPAIQRQLVRLAVDSLRGLRDVSAEHIESVVQLANAGETGERRSLPGLTARRGYRSLFIGPGDRPIPEWPLVGEAEKVAVQLPGLTPLPGSRWALRVEAVPAEELPDVVQTARRLARQRRGMETSEVPELAAVIDARVAQGGLWVRPRQRGESFQPLGLRGRSRTLHEYMIDAQIPNDVRDRVPLVVNAEQVVWVGGFRLDHRARVTPETSAAWRLTWVRHAAG
ncbi:MAG: tRNA lysidine(34) synthetase TilS [Anaerolineae bacterium]|nr:tRNA lysidine(34) synthetase TilS [Anaerolineae bacterium]